MLHAGRLTGRGRVVVRAEDSSHIQLTLEPVHSALEGVYINHDVGVHKEQNLTFRALGTSVSRGARSRLVWEPHNLGAAPFGDGAARVCRC